MKMKPTLRMLTSQGEKIIKLTKETSENEVLAKQLQQSHDALTVLELKHSDTKHEQADLEEEKKELKTALKISQKELKETNYKLEKKAKALEDSFKELNDEKPCMQQERVSFKNKTKNINIKLKAIEERVSKLKIEELNFEKQKSETETKPELEA